ncbi:MAG: YebC/PmpR family DNA-binding transcriptional regulator [Clostridia bacterium]
MSGHSKWNNIKRQKGKSDAAKGKVFTKIGREITVCVRNSGADINTNTKLRDLIQKAKQNNMPNDTIDRCIKKASGDMNSVDYTAINYEGYGIGGSAVIVEALTDNKNRTAGDIRHYFDKYNGSLGTTGCVSYSFEQKGVLIIEKNEKVNEDELMMTALEAGALDVEVEEDSYEVYTISNDISKVQQSLESAGYEIVSSEVSFIPQTEITLSQEQENIFKTMIEKLEDLDDVQEVYHNVCLSYDDEDDEE